MKTTEINESMKLRFMLLRENGYEVERAQKCSDFIHDGAEEEPPRLMAGIGETEPNAEFMQLRI